MLSSVVNLSGFACVKERSRQPHAALNNQHTGKLFIYLCQVIYCQVCIYTHTVYIHIRGHTLVKQTLKTIKLTKPTNKLT